MNVYSELAILQDAPLPMAISDEEIPCVETSDPDRICQRPLVSVVMTTYNHEKFIREAIEGVLAQKADFEYELIIGEDCSQDATREICFEYQRRFPDRIRVLWSDGNVYKCNGNERRCRHRVRGRFLAFCEGDDYWTDPFKLQKQVGLMERTGSVMCVAFADWRYPDGKVAPDDYERKEFIGWEDFSRHYFHTSTFLIRKATLDALSAGHPNLRLWYSMALCYGLATRGRICLLPETVSVYRLTGAGIATRLSVRGFDLLQLDLYLPLLTYLPAEPACRRFWHEQVMAKLWRLLRYEDRESLRFLRRHALRIARLYLRQAFSCTEFRLRHRIHLTCNLIVALGKVAVRCLGIRVPGGLVGEVQKYR